VNLLGFSRFCVSLACVDSHHYSLSQALFAMQKILVNRVPMLFVEPRMEYVPAVRRFATAWRQLWVVKHWPV
jgi:hypothetical protein